MNFEKLRILLILAFMAVSLVPLASLGYKAISQGETLIKEQTSSYLEGLADRNAEAIKGFMIERANDLSALSNIICLFGFNDTILKTHFEQMRSQYTPYLGFFILDEFGEPVFSTLDISIDATQLHTIRESTNTSLETDVKEIFMFTSGPEQIPALLICTPILAGSKESCRHLCALVDFRLVGKLLIKSNIEVTGEVYLVDKKGKFLSASRFGAKALKDSISMSSIAGKEQGLYETIDYRGERVLQAYHKVDAFPWYVIADQDMAEILNRIKALGKEAIVYGMLTAMVVFGLALLISKKIVNILKAK